MNLTKASDTKYGPCHVEFSRRFNVFIVGTYSLVKDVEHDLEQLKKCNYRRGSFAVFNEENELIFTHVCDQGGVYDFKLLKNEEFQDNTETILAAHANGTFALYYWTKSCIEFYKCLPTSCDLLCSIDYLLMDSSILIVTGGSNGWLSRSYHSIEIKDRKFTSGNEKVSNQKLYNDNIWYVKLLKVHTSKVLFIGSEEAHLEIFQESGDELKIVKKLFKPFECGVTSIEFAFDDNFEQSNTCRLFVGCYDDHLRLFICTFTNDSLDNLQVNCQLMQSVNLKGATWRMFIIGDRLLASVMKEGVIIADLKKDSLEIDCYKQLIEKEPRLVYGVACNPTLSVIMAASFDDHSLLRYQNL